MSSNLTEEENMFILEDLKGQWLHSIEGLYKGSDMVTLNTTDGRYKFYHEQDCCETVDLYDFDGEAKDVKDSIIFSIEEVNGESVVEEDKCFESTTWTFYKIETSRGGIFMRWLGASNGYYSEEVSYCKIN